MRLAISVSLITIQSSLGRSNRELRSRLYCLVNYSMNSHEIDYELIGDDMQIVE